MDTKPVTNTYVAGRFRELADLLLEKKDNWFKIRAYRKVAEEIERLPVEITGMVAADNLRQIPGVGEAIEKKIKEIVATGTIQTLERLRAELKESKVG
jgi:DNA polymerase (family 10)